MAVCQALDLRALNAEFNERLRDIFEEAFEDLGSHILELTKKEATKGKCWTALLHRLDTTTSLDSNIRIPSAVTSLQPLLLEAFPESVKAVSALKRFTCRLSEQALRLYIDLRTQYLDSGSAEELLGRGTRPLYEYMRKDLEIPFVGPQTLSTPTSTPGSSKSQDGDRGITMGDINGRVRRSMAEGGLYRVVIECWRDFGVEAEIGKKGTRNSIARANVSKRELKERAKL